MGLKDYDFSGWASRNDVLCSDGTTIRSGCFADDDGREVPLVWNHGHMDPTNVLGSALIKHSKEGTRVYCKFNGTDKAQHVKQAVKEGNIKKLSVCANELIHKAGNILHGKIKEVSLVLSGADPTATIDTVLAHSDDICDGYGYDFADGDVIITSDQFIELSHSNDDNTPNNAKKEDPKPANNSNDDNETVQDVIDSMNEKQKQVLYFMVGQAVEDAKGTSTDDKENDDVKHSVFMGNNQEDVIMHNAINFGQMLSDAKRIGSLKEAYIQHCEANGIDEDMIMHADGERYGIMPKLDGSGQPVEGSYGIDMLFPEYRTVGGATPEWIKRNTDWVDIVLRGVHHTPFSRIKSIFADITEDDARARGYMKGNYKKEEVFSLLKRTTDPQTIYKKQKLDRDDVIDITDFDVVAWIKAEMRMMLDEEIARASLVGDGRLNSSDDKISQDHIRSIYLDDDFYSNKVAVKVAANATEDAIAKSTIRAIIKNRKDYKGSGNPIFFTTSSVLTDMLLLEDANGRIIYDTEEKLRTALRVSRIVEVEVLENQKRTDANGVTRDLLGIIVNLSDYNIGADKGGAVNMFDDFDIDYNQMKYLIETRISGALTKPHSAMVIELEKAEAEG